MPTIKDEYFPQELKCTQWFRKLFTGPIQSVKMNANEMADIRKFSRDDLDHTDSGFEHGTAEKGWSFYLGSLDGIEIYSWKGLPLHHFFITMKDGSTRFYCEKYHVMLSKDHCPYCSGEDTSTPVSDFEVPPIPPPPPPSRIGLITNYLEVRPESQKKFEAFEVEHQKECCPNYTSHGRWEFTFRYANAAPVAAWIEVKVRCIYCETEWVIQDDEPELETTGEVTIHETNTLNQSRTWMPKRSSPGNRLGRLNLKASQSSDPSPV